MNLEAFRRILVKVVFRKIWANLLLRMERAVYGNRLFASKGEKHYSRDANVLGKYPTENVG